MTLPILVTCGALIGVGLVCLSAAFIRPRPALGPALNRLSGARITTPTLEQADGQPHTSSLTTRLGARVERALGHRVGFGAPERDLALLERTHASYYGEKAAYATAALLLVPTLVALSLLTGWTFPMIPAVICLPLAVAGWFLPDLEIKSKAAEARQEWRYFIVAYLQLVAIKRASGGAPTDTVMSAAQISDSWVMLQVRRALVKARWAGQQPWDAFTDLAETIGVQEISEVGDIMRMAAEQGSQVVEQLLARSNTLMHRLLTEEEADAKSRTERMALPITSLVIVLMITILLPVSITMFTT